MLRRIAGMPSETRLESTVRAERIAFTGEHSGRILIFALEGEDARGVWEIPGHVFAAKEAQDFSSSS